MKRIKLLLLLSLVLGGISLATAPSALAYEECPDGWSEVTDNQIGWLTQFCVTGVLDAPSGAELLYFLKVPSIAVGQAVKLPNGDPNNSFGSALDPNPQFDKMSVKDWEPYLNNFWGISVTINGTFFNDTVSSTSSISYPLFSGNALVDTGNEPAGDEIANRACHGFGGAGDQETGPWTYADDDWSGVEANNECIENVFTHHRVVGLEPTWFPGGDVVNALTMMGISDDPEDVCFLVGGWQNREDLADRFEEFDCTATVQLDGGCSTQLSWYDPVANAYVDAIEGYLFCDWNRPVPHVIALF